MFNARAFAPVEAARKRIDEIDFNGQFLQPFGKKFKYNGNHCFEPEAIVLSHSVSPTKLHPTLIVNKTGNYCQLLRTTLYKICQ